MSISPGNDADTLAFSIENRPALDIKDEQLSDEPPEIDGTLLEDLLVQRKPRRRKLSPAPSLDEFNFCMLCLRKCSPRLKVTFQLNPEPNTVNLTLAESKVARALGIQKDLHFRAMCLTCWQMIELITDFRQFCEITTKKMKVFSAGIDCNPQKDEWMAKSTQNAIDLKRQMIRRHLGQLNVEESKAKQAARQKKSTQQKTQAKVTKLEVSPVIGQDEAQNDALEEPKIESCQPSTSAAEELIQLEDENYKVNICTCETCGRNFDGVNSLRVHKTHCKPDAPMTGKFFTCPICTATFIENSGLTFHLNKHKGIRPFKCRKFCDNTFFSNFTRIKHERKYCEKEGRICDICGIHLKNEASLLAHTETVHGEAKYPCDVCGRKFRCKKTRTLHRRVHSDERKYVCTVCNKAYKAPFSLSIHKRIHTQDFPYPCHLCERVFNYKVSLKNHIERHHAPNDDS